MRPNATQHSRSGSLGWVSVIEGVNSELATHLASHHGLVRRADVVPDVITLPSFKGLVARGELVRVHRGVYRHAAVPVTLEQRIRAAMIAIGDEAVLSHRAALARHGVRNFQCALVEITHRSTALPRQRGLQLHRSANLSDADVQVLDGVRTTAPARTLIDAASVLPVELVARYTQEWMSHRKVSEVDLTSALSRAGNHSGARALAGGLGDVIAEADTGAEARLGEILIKAGLPPEHHVVVTTAAGDDFEIDWAYPSERIGLELDGYGVHLRSRAIYEKDRDRRNELEVEGWRILNFTDAQCRRPARVVDQVRRALSASRSVV
jgi:very-short-patch-repair endonuclease